MNPPLVVLKSPKVSTTVTESSPRRILLLASTRELAPIAVALVKFLQPKQTLAWDPIAVLRSPVLLNVSAADPTAVLVEPVVFSERALCPVAVFSRPVVLLLSALLPVATFLKPVVLSRSAFLPVATLLKPVVLDRSGASFLP